MMFLNRIAESRPHHVSINLRGRNIRMSQHDLYATQVRTVLQQMGSKTVPQNVRRQPAENARFFTMDRQQFPKTPAA
jgi:hypothetical protein